METIEWNVLVGNGVCCGQPSLVPRKAASALEGSQQGTCSGARSPRAGTLFFLTSIKTKPTYRASLLRGRWRSRQTGRRRASTDVCLHLRHPVWRGTRPQGGSPARTDGGREWAWAELRGAPEGKPGTTRVTLPLQVRPVAPEDRTGLVALGKPTGAVRREGNCAGEPSPPAPA